MNPAFRWLKSTRQSKYTIDEPHFSSWNLLTLTAMCLCTVRLVRHTVDMILRTDEISAGERELSWADFAGFTPDILPIF